MPKFHVDYSIEQDYNSNRVDTWTVYMYRQDQVSLEICTCLDENKANLIAVSLEQTGTIFE